MLESRTGKARLGYFVAVSASACAGLACAATSASAQESAPASAPVPERIEGNQDIPSSLGARRFSGEGATSRVEGTGICRNAFDLAQYANTQIDGAGCPFGTFSLASDYRSKFETDLGEITVSFGMSREADSGFSLTQQLSRPHSGVVRESALTTAGIQAQLAGGDVSISSTLGLSRNWERPLSPDELFPYRFNERSGLSQSHSIKAKLLDDGANSLTLDAKLDRADQDFRYLRGSSLDRLLLASDNSTSVRAVLKLQGTKLDASLRSNATFLSDSHTRKLKLSRGGIGVEYSRRDAVTVADQAIGNRASSSTRDRYGITLDLYGIAPTLAFSDSGAAQFLPKQVGIALEKRGTLRELATELQRDRKTAIELTGLWQTGLGTTILNQRSEKGTSTTARAEMSSNQLFASHIVTIGNWDIGADILRFSNSTAQGQRESTSLYSASLGYRAKSGPRVQIDIGQEAMNFGGSDSEFTFADKSFQIGLELDMTPVLRRKLERDDIYLTAAFRINLNRSDYELRLFDEVLDRETDAYNRQGLMLTFGMNL